MKELRVYVINIDEVDFESEMPVNITVSQTLDEKFMNIAEKQGGVYTIQGFQNAFNEEKINTAVDVIRFIEVEV